MSLKEENFDVIIREFIYRDYKDLHKKIFNDEDVMKFSLSGVTSINYTKKFIKQQITNNKSYRISIYAIIKKDTNELIGQCGLIPITVNNCIEFEFGFRLAKKYWNKGYGFLAAKQVLKIINDDAKLKRIISIINPENIPARKLLNKLNFTFKESTLWHNQKVDIYIKQNS